MAALANNVRQESTTTGLGDFTLGAVVDSGRTVSSQYALNERLPYFIDDRAGNWEHGIGYLSGANTLVRETFLDSSTGAFINFGAGTKQVYVSDSAQIREGRSVGVLSSGSQLIRSSHYTRSTNSGYAVAANRIHYVPFILDRPARVIGMGVEVTSPGAASTVAHFSLYDMDAAKDPKARIISVAGQPIDSTGLAIGSVPEVMLCPGEYWFTHWSNGTPSYAANTSYEWASPVQFGGDASQPERDIVMRFKSSQTSLSELPNPATVPDNNNWSVGPVYGYLELV